MPDTPLNPEALEAASREVFREVLGFTKAQSARVARRAVSAYLAVAQPGGWEQQAKNFTRVIDRLTAENEALKAAEQKVHSDAGWATNMDRQGGA
ncbi:hypothetical protein [Glutamicibacter mishrai]|uniref:hypothetical protein n=1 Tax=Glutamicibacter mishrai TaxID=1775880 RepID=UPI003F79DA49